MKITTILIAFLILVTTTVQATSLREEYPACLSEELLDQLVTASINKDQRGIQYMLKNGCIAVREGIEISVLDRTWNGKAKVRAYVGDKAIVLWTTIEAIKE